MFVCKLPSREYIECSIISVSNKNGVLLFYCTPMRIDRTLLICKTVKFEHIDFFYLEINAKCFFMNYKTVKHFCFRSVFCSEFLFTIKGMSAEQDKVDIFIAGQRAKNTVYGNNTAANLLSRYLFIFVQIV